MERDKREEPPLPPLPYARLNVETPPANKTNHSWKQKGIRIHCDQCPEPHGFLVKPNQQLTGINDNGYPIISKL